MLCSRRRCRPGAVRRHWAPSPSTTIRNNRRFPAETTSTASNSRSNSASTGRSRSAIWLSLMCVLRSGWVKQLCATTPEYGSAGPDGAVSQHTRAALGYGRRMASSGAPASLPFGRREALVFLASLPVALAGCGASDPAINEPRINSSGHHQPSRRFAIGPATDAHRYAERASFRSGTRTGVSRPGRSHQHRRAARRALEGPAEVAGRRPDRPS